MTIRVGLVDSGVNPEHPHVRGVAAAARVESTAAGPVLLRGSAADEIGHGTACAGLLRWFAPDAEIVAVRIFDRTLRASAERLPLALAFCLESGARLINLSLGLPAEEVPVEVRAAMDAAAAAGALVVAACGHGALPSWPAAHPDTIAVAPDPFLAPGVLAWVDGGIAATGASAAKPLLLAAPFPRPMPGQARERNMTGVSFAAAAVAGLFARAGIADRSGLDRASHLAVERFESRAAWLAARGVS